MPEISRSNLLLGLCCVVFALVVALVWVPMDINTGIIERVRGRYSIGDALAPTVAAGFILLGGLMLLFVERTASNQVSLNRDQFKFITAMILVVVAGVVIMRYAGPGAAAVYNLFSGEPVEYRLLRATAGWRHIGFVLGGVVMITGMVTVVEHGFSKRALWTGILAVAIMIVIFDLPFEDLQLPPNGDV